MDLKKEIKLSDLFAGRRRRRQGRPPRTKPASESRKQQAKKQEIVGLKIGASQIAAAKVMNNGGTPRLEQLARSPLEAGVVVAGEVRDVEALSLALDAFFTENNLPRRGIRLGIGTNRIGVRSLDVEGIDDEQQLGNAVRFRAHEALSIPMDQAVLDYHVTRETVNESGGVSRRVLLAAAYQEPIDHYVQAFQAANLELVGIDVEAFALLRAVAPDQPAAEAAVEPVAVVALALGYDRSTLAISDGTVCDFMRVLEWGGSRLDAVIGRDLGLTLEEAAEVKLSVSLEPEMPRMLIQGSHVPREQSRANLKHSAASSSPRCSFTRASRDRFRSLRSSSRAAPPGCRARRRAGTPHSRSCESWSIRSCSSRRGRMSATVTTWLRSAIAIGLGDGAVMQAVNLLPAYARPAGRWASVGKELVTGASSNRRDRGCSLRYRCGGPVLLRASVVNDRRATLTDAQARLTAVEAIAAPLRAAQASNAARAAAVSSVANTRVPWETVLGGLSRVLPSQVYLQNLQAQAAAPVAAAVPGAPATPAPARQGSP